MDIIFYVIIFIIGNLIGGIWSIEVRKIPQELDLRKINYNQKRKQDLYSEMAYILIGGISAVFLTMIFNLNIKELEISKAVILAFALMYISTLMIIAGVDKQYAKISKKMLAFGIISSILYMVYLLIVKLTSLKLYAIYLLIYLILLIMDCVMLRKYALDSYIINMLILLSIILVFTDLLTVILTISLALIATILYLKILQIEKKKNGNKEIKISEVPIGYFICIGNIIVLVMIRIFESYLV